MSKTSSNLIHVLEPYVFWEGHYRQYFENLKSESHRMSYCHSKSLNFKNEKCIKAVFTSYGKSFICFCLSRLINAVRLNAAVAFEGVSTGSLYHFVEFEPVSFLFFELLTGFKKKKVLLTIHSVKRVSSEGFLANLVLRFQRLVFNLALKHARQKGYSFAVHYQCHGKQLKSVLNGDGDITVIPYPSPCPQVSQPRKQNKGNRLLVFGQIRSDKGIYEFLSSAAARQLKITIAGRIMDQRVHSLSCKNWQFVDRFIAEDELSELFEANDFCLLPYRLKYTGGAGPLSLACAYGLPIICSNIDVFKGFVTEHNLGFCYETIGQIAKFLERIDDAEYCRMSRYAFETAKQNDWSTMRTNYLELYNRILS